MGTESKDYVGQSPFTPQLNGAASRLHNACYSFLSIAPLSHGRCFILPIIWCE